MQVEKVRECLMNTIIKNLHDVNLYVARKLFTDFGNLKTFAEESYRLACDGGMYRLWQSHVYKYVLSEINKISLFKVTSIDISGPTYDLFLADLLKLYSESS